MEEAYGEEPQDTAGNDMSGLDESGLLLNIVCYTIVP